MRLARAWFPPSHPLASADEPDCIKASMQPQLVEDAPPVPLDGVFAQAGHTRDVTGGHPLRLLSRDIMRLKGGGGAVRHGFATPVTHPDVTARM